MGVFLIIVGIGWALIGVGNFVGGVNSGTLSQNMQTFSLLFQMMIFIIPGLILAGIGSGIRRKKAKKDPVVIEEPTRPCPFCAETIKAAAVVCRYCNRDLHGPETA